MTKDIINFLWAVFLTFVLCFWSYNYGKHQGRKLHNADETVRRSEILHQLNDPVITEAINLDVDGITIWGDPNGRIMVI
ncbi:hypothetical protein LCGC14_1411980 [marine sediment metagenome]|uniref:Uncharacterized protein n=1 Tax=marine sediment metagenome TaxID=412755 RepID=A0A0F9M9F5_9ZZZZ|nr:hypothetical protein [Pricia sp.]